MIRVLGVLDEVLDAVEEVGPLVVVEEPELCGEALAELVVPRQALELLGGPTELILPVDIHQAGHLDIF